MRLNRRRKRNDILNVTPLIDVVFILLVFFMLATSFAQYRLIGVDSPQESEVTRDSDGAVVVLLTLDGGVEVDGDPVPRDQLLEAVNAVLALDPNRTFLVRPERGVALQEAITAYGLVRSAGARGVTFSRPFEDGGAS